MESNLRFRGSRNNKIIELAKTLDAFKKVPEKYTETTQIGGTLSLISRLLIIYLVYSEIRFYQDPNLIFQFQPDIDMDDKVQMHVDITVAMPCTALSGVDLMDETQQDVFAYGTLQREGTWWEMSEDERTNFVRMQHMNSFLREQYHSIADILFKDIIKSNEIHDAPKTNAGKPLPEEKYDACRLHGTLGINKVAGVLHLVGGAQPVVGLFENHLLIEFRRLPANFTHRINRLSFGQYSKRIVQPLEGDEIYVHDEATTIQYFLKIVPTEIHNTFSTINTYQYSVTENVRKLDSEKNSYGSPGIYFKYDWSALKIIVRTDRERDNPIQFAIRLCSIVAGIIVISSILNTFLQAIYRLIIMFLAPQLLNDKRLKYKKTDNSNIAEESNTPPRIQVVSTPTAPNDLISNANKMSNLVMDSLPTTPPIMAAYFPPTSTANENSN